MGGWGREEEEQQQEQKREEEEEEEEEDAGANFLVKILHLTEAAHEAALNPADSSPESNGLR